MAINPDNYIFAGTYCAGLYRSNIQVPIAERTISNKDCWAMINMPNPVRKNSLIMVKLSSGDNVNLRIYDRQGRLVKELAQNLSRGDHGIIFNGLDDRGMSMSTGIYFLQASSKTKSLYQKFVYLQ
ncbi:hypothetical protein A2Y85_02060 [candidate division WOR-3 bacterium RBG_13_43_14]|uniref:FlgD/Vpr Ig-like domain-containing protein n=1 Tax=candidate division WOR-3 bacterium RBG_13_43_14 TaxID=1802590 RepID=A0A1F4U2M9_UNCW3|nr:MAG: hypothetical protein A2Y85_02060 [candidate division WOR-3 bacterium RBG_13_43_14]